MNNKSYDFCYYEQDMTMQVAMLGADGFLIASDILVSNCSPPQNSRKIFTSESGNVVIAAAGCKPTGHFARDLVRDLGEFNLATFDRGVGMVPEIENVIVSAAEKLFQGYKDDYVRMAKDITESGSRLIVAVSGFDKLWEIVFATGKPTMEALTARYAINNGSNQASFFAHQYFSAEKTVNELLPIAAHTILEGARIQPAFVGGLDIYASESGEGRFLRDAEIEMYSEHSRKVHDSLASEFARVE